MGSSQSNSYPSTLEPQVHIIRGYYYSFADCTRHAGIDFRRYTLHWRCVCSPVNVYNVYLNAKSLWDIPAHIWRVTLSEHELWALSNTCKHWRQILS
jgi:hypothetical protein